MLPGPTNVPDAVMNAMLTPIINHRSPPFSKLYKGLVEKVQKVFETTGEIVILSSSGTGAVEASVVNLVRPGDSVIVPVYGEFSERLAEQVEGAGGHVTSVKAPFGDATRMGALEEAFENAKTVKALYVVYNETSTGVTFRWLKEAGELCAKYGAYFVVDAISILGGDELPVDKLGVDICVTGSQKALAAPPGLGLISLSDRAKKFAIEHPLIMHYFNLPRYFEYTKRGETPFTPALPLLHALDAALDIIIEEGMPARIARHRACANALYSGFEAMGLQPFAKKDVRSNTVVAINYPRGLDDVRFRNLLDEKFHILVAGGFGPYKGKLFRVGCMGEVTDYHVAVTMASITQTMGLMGVKVNAERAMEAAVASVSK